MNFNENYDILTTGDIMIENEKFKKGQFTLIAYFIIFYLLAGIISEPLVMILKLFNIDITNPHFEMIANGWMNFVIYFILLITLLYINYKELKSDVFSFKDKTPNKGIVIAGSFAIFYIISLFISTIVSEIEYNFNFGYSLLGIDNFLNVTSDNQTGIEAMMRTSGAIPMFISAALLGPICEELVFRKAFFDMIKKPEIALIVSSVLFGLIHVITSFGNYNLLELFLMLCPYIASGIALGYVYIRSNQNIVVPILVHIISNTISLVMILLMPLMEQFM